MNSIAAYGLVGLLVVSVLVLVLDLLSEGKKIKAKKNQQNQDQVIPES